MGALLSYFKAENWQGTMMLCLAAIVAIVTAKSMADDYGDDLIWKSTLIRFGVAFIVMFVATVLASYYAAWSRCSSGISISSVMSNAVWPGMLVALTNMIIGFITTFLYDPFFYTLFTIGSYTFPVLSLLYYGPLVLGTVKCVTS